MRFYQHIPEYSVEHNGRGGGAWAFFDFNRMAGHEDALKVSVEAVLTSTYGQEVQEFLSQKTDYNPSRWDLQRPEPIQDVMSTLMLGEHQYDLEIQRVYGENNSWHADFNKHHPGSLESGFDHVTRITLGAFFAFLPGERPEITFLPGGNTLFSSDPRNRTRTARTDAHYQADLGHGAVFNHNTTHSSPVETNSELRDAHSIPEDWLVARLFIDGDYYEK